MPNIKVLAGGGFVEQEVRSETICELREELDISSGASVAVNGSNKANSYSLQDGDLVAAVSNDKTGGTKTTKTTKRKPGRPKTTRKVTVITAYNNLAEMGRDVRSVMKSFVNQDEKYTVREGAVIGSLYGQELKRIKLELDVHNAGLGANPASDVLSLDS